LLTRTATLYGGESFTPSGGFYTFNFPGGVPPKNTTHLLVVDPTTKKVVLVIHNKLGNWSPQDAINFCGKGPIQITGRYNYQLFADYMKDQDIMTNPAMLADNANSSQASLGMTAAGWYWETEYNRKLNEKTNNYAWRSAAAFNTAISEAINRWDKKSFPRRLANYLRIRSLLLKANF
jgi:hypothetical protein